VELALDITLPSISTLRRNSGPIAPTGFVFLVDSDGAYLLDADGSYLMEAA
jgi:hypothetical protein